jgi:hypothetical protein
VVRERVVPVATSAYVSVDERIVEPPTHDGVVKVASVVEEVLARDPVAEIV